jgi:dienelactone hydrolase
MESSEISLDMRYGDLIRESPFKEAKELIFARNDEKGDEWDSLPLREMSPKAIGWIPPHTVESLRYFLEASKHRQVYYPYPGSAFGCFAFPIPVSKGLGVVIPGGGYNSVSMLAEGFPVAQRLNELGYDALIVGYRTAKQAAYPHVLEDGIEALKMVFKQNILGKTPTNYFVMGFSAGGHLAGLLASERYGALALALPAPKTAILAYPVTSLILKTDEETKTLFAGDRLHDEAFLREFSLENLVTPRFPKTYLWGCVKDPCISLEETAAFEKALQANRVAYFRKLYDAEGHGWALGEKTPAAGWLNTALAFHEEGRR